MKRWQPTATTYERDAEACCCSSWGGADSRARSGHHIRCRYEIEGSEELIGLTPWQASEIRGPSPAKRLFAHIPDEKRL